LNRSAVADPHFPWPGSTHENRAASARRHRRAQLVPREPRGAAEHIELTSAVVPVQRVAREQVVVVDVVQHAASRVTRRGDRANTRGDVGDVEPADEVGRERRGDGVGLMDPHACAEPLGVALRVGDVVAMRQQDVCDPALCLERVGERGDPPRRIDEQVALVADDEVAVRAEGRLVVVPAQMDACGERPGERARRRAASRDRADGLGRAGERGAPHRRLFVARRRLPRDDGQAFVVGLDQTGRVVPSDVAVDATRVAEPVAGDVVRVTLVEARHDPSVRTAVCTECAGVQVARLPRDRNDARGAAPRTA
jgi:hypothetical protein